MDQGRSLGDTRELARPREQVVVQRDRGPHVDPLSVPHQMMPSVMLRGFVGGSLGEERLGARLDQLASDHLRLLHDRKIPGSSANIDHLAVTPNGVFVIDTKRYKGRPRLAVEGGLFRPRIERLIVAGRDRSHLVDGVLRQVEVVRGVVGDAVPVRGVLCFVEADWPLIGGSFLVRDAAVFWPKALYPRLREQGPMPQSELVRVHELLARRFRRA